MFIGIIMSRPISMSAIFSFFEDGKTIRKGENSVNSGFVQNMVFDNALFVVRGDVQASMKNRTYKVEIFLCDGQITECTCSCPKGLDLCHHMVALAIFAHNNLSTTDIACRWNKPKGSQDVAPLTSEVCFAKSESTSSYCPLLVDEISEESVSKFMDDLKLCGPIGFGWLLSPESELSHEKVVPAPEVQEIIFSDEFLRSKDKIKYIEEKLQISEEKIREINDLTVGQSKNPLWLIVKKHRITASNFGRVIKAYRRSRFPPSLFQTLTGSYNLDGIKQIQWGRSNEEVAIKKFNEIHGVQIKECGIWLHSCGYLGASPDGFIDDDTVVEVKCPYKYRDELFRDCLLNNRDYILMFNGEEYIVNKNHDYFHQIQGQLEITGTVKCILILWTTKDFLEVCIKKDNEWSQNIDLLKNFYLKNYINHILT